MLKSTFDHFPSVNAMRVSQSLRLGLCFDLLDSVQSDLSQLGDGGLVQLDLGQVVLLDPRDGVVLGVGQRSAKNKKLKTC